MCILVWHGEPQGGGGAYAAFIDPAKAQPIWKKKFSPKGAHPAIGMTATGQAQLAWYEGTRVATASVTRDNVGQITKFARVTGEQPVPSIAAGTRSNEWLIAWLDYETGQPGHLEPYAARVSCNK
jgi:serine/threonine-protein kinase